MHRCIIVFIVGANLQQLSLPGKEKKNVEVKTAGGDTLLA